MNHLFKHKLRLSTSKIHFSIGAACFAVLFAAIGYHFLRPSFAATVAPSNPPVEICSVASQLNGPATAPAGAVTIPAGDNSSQVDGLQADTIYYFASGTHTLGTGQYNQINPAANDTFIGAPGAIIDGQNKNNFAFVGNDSSITGVTIEYLTIQNFIAPGSQGAVNTNSNDNWTIEHDTVQNVVPGAAMMIGSNNTIQYNCLTHNGEYAFNGYQDPSDPQSSTLTDGPKDITVSNNEISYNNTCNWDAVSDFPITEPSGCAGAGQFNGCGCDGGGKFWAADQVTYDNNYVHDNYSVGMWADTNNNGFDVEGNYFSNNWGEAIIYEVSYNALIKDNTFLDNANGGGPQNPGFPDSAIYISESGGDSRVPGFSSGSLQITANVFTDNWGGVVLWENSNRYCSSSANSSTGTCTLVNPTVANLTTCADATDLAKTPYINDCRWKTQNVSVDHNAFNFTPGNIGANCTTDNTCGYNALFSEYGSYAPYTAWVVPNNLSNNQSDTFSDNTYNGPWNFMGFGQGDTVSWSQWNSGFDDWNGSGDHFNTQDAGSTYNSTITDTTPPTTPSNVTASAVSSTSINVTWDASTDSGGSGLAGYYIYRDGTQVGSVNASTTSFTDSNLSPSTAYNYTVAAYDGAGNTSTASSIASATTPANTAQSPTVSFTALANNALIHGTSYSISTNASPHSGNTLSKAQLLVNGTVVQTITTSPYTFTLNTTSYRDGTYTITVQATDNHNNVGVANVTVVITNGDINGDNKVNLSDLSILSSNWNKSGSYSQGDLNGDSKINLQDLSLLANNWQSQW